MRLIGESFKDYVVSQIDVRQSLAGSGYNNSRRTDQQIQLLSNRNAWLKLASSVRILSEADVKANLIKSGISEDEAILAVKNYENGEKRLKKIGFNNTSDFLGNKLAKKSVLFNSLSEVIPSQFSGSTKTVRGKYKFRAGVDPSNSLWNSNYAYGLGGTEFGLTPPPGLIDADIKCINRGSIREANVTLKAYNQFQFELIETLYLRLGYSMLLEWGWDRYFNDKGEYKTFQQSLTEDLWFRDLESYNFKKVIKAIERYRGIYQGNYDGFLGKVTNFDWSFNPDGSYDIKLKLITVGDVIESLKVNLPTAIKSPADIEKQLENYTSPDKFNNLGVQSSPTNLAATDLVVNAGTSTLAYDLFTDMLGETKKWTSYQGAYMNLYFLLNWEKGQGVKLEIEGDDEGEAVDIDKYGYYLTFGKLLEKLTTFCIPTVSHSKIVGFETNVDEVICSAYPNQISLDPRICLIKPYFTKNVGLNNYEEFKKNKQGVKAYWRWMKRMRPFTVAEENDTIFYGKVMNIYLNYNFVSECLADETDDGEVYLYKFLQKICDGVNGALGGIMKLEPVIQDDMKIIIQDQNQIRGIKKSSYKNRFIDSPNFELFGYNTTNVSGSYLTTSNFVRDFSFQTNITPDLASMISIGATANAQSTKNYDATAFSKWNQGLKDQYAFDFKDPKLVDEDKNTVKESKYDYSPFTLEQIEELNTAFKNAESDNRVFLNIFKRSNFDTEYSKFGFTHKGEKVVLNSPVTGKNYRRYTWPEYVDEIAEEIRDGIEVEQDQEVKFADNYIGYLIQALRGKVQGNAVTTNYYFHLNEEFIKTGKQAFKSYVDAINNLTYKVTANPSTTIGFIPVDLGLKCDGLSGINIYNALNIRQEFLPPQYPNALEFVITKVDHKISDNDWETSLGTISTPKTAASNVDNVAFSGQIIEQVSGETQNYIAYDGSAPTVSLTRNYSLENSKTRSGLIYYPEQTSKTAIIIHHTAGNQDAKGEITSNWNTFTYPIGTQYIIERTGQEEHVFPDAYWSNHTGVSPKLSKKMLAIEICNIGWLTKMADGRYKNAYGTTKSVDAFPAGVSKPYTLNSNNELVEMESYRNRKYFEEYTDEALATLAKILKNWNTTYNIPIDINFTNITDMFPASGQRSDRGLKASPGLYSHNSIRTDKLDISPTKKMIKFLRDIA